MSEWAARDAITARPGSSRPDRHGHPRHGHPPLPDPGGGTDRRRPRSACAAPPSTSPPPAPATATASRWPTTWSAAAPPSTSWSSASRSCPTSPTATTAGPRSSSATAPARPSSDRRDVPAIGPDDLGLRRRAVGDHLSRTRAWMRGARRRTSGWPTIGMQGQSVFRWAVWGMAPVAQQALDAAGITADDLDAFIPHQANMRIIDAMAKQLKLPADIAVARDIADTANTSRRLHPAGDRADAAREGGPQRRPGPADRLRRRPGLRRAGRRPALTRSRGPTGHSGHHATTTREDIEGDTDGTERAGDPRRTGRDRQRGDRPRHRVGPARTSPSPTTSTSTRCR